MANFQTNLKHDGRGKRAGVAYILTTQADNVCSMVPDNGNDHDAGYCHLQDCFE